MTAADGRYRVGVDIGGTFTDIVALCDDGRVHVKKVSSTVDNYARGIVEAIGQLISEGAFNASRVAEVVHGSTVASNAILELKGARTGLITTRGFRDVLEIRRLRMPRLYDLTWEKPPPLVERYLRTEVDERLDSTGAVVQPLDLDSVQRAAEQLLSNGVEAIAVCLLNAYVNPMHERAVADVLREMAPEVLVSLSSDVLPEIREYERTSTTVINAYILPVVQGYLRALGDDLATIGIGAPVMMMQSSGGIMSARAAAARPMHIVESGPAAGVMGAQALAHKMQFQNLLTLDIGGTTAKASLIEDGSVSRTAEYEVGGGILVGSRLFRGGGYALRSPAIDLAEVGAGGGSLIWIDRGGSVKVGPKSAGSLPGPVCYGLGGTQATLTDANVALGYLSPRVLAGGAVQLDAQRGCEALRQQVAEPLGISLEEAAHGAHLIGAANMIRAIRAVSSERGRDPREYALCAFGGNGPVFAATMAQSLGIETVIVPLAPGLFSSFGLLFTAVEHNYVRSLNRLLDTEAVDALRAGFGALEHEAGDDLRTEGHAPDQVRFARSIDLRYVGQSFELSIPLTHTDLTARGLADLKVAFGAEHQRRYGHRADANEPLEVGALRLVARVASQAPAPDTLSIVNMHALGGRPATTRRAYFGPRHGWMDTPIVGSRTDLGTAEQHGPLIVEEYDSTTVVPPGSSIRTEDFGNLRLKVRA